MTLAEDLGYNDTYFPITDDPDATPFDPSSEYILSHSPPVIDVDVMSSLESRVDDNGLGLDRGNEEDTSNIIETGTRLSPETPSGFSHIPSTALTPSDLSPGPEIPRIPEHIQNHGQPIYPSGETDHSPPSFSPSSHSQSSTIIQSQQQQKQQPMKRPRAKSHSNLNKVAEAVFFSYGVSVFFGFAESEERTIMEDCEGAGVWLRGQEEDDWEVEEFHYVVSPPLLFCLLLKERELILCVV